MFVDSQIENKLKDDKAKVGVIITCSGNVSRVEDALKQHGVEVTGGIPEFLTINAVLNKQQLTNLKDTAGIGSIELDEVQGI